MHHLIVSNFILLSFINKFLNKCCADRTESLKEDLFLNNESPFKSIDLFSIDFEF